MELIDEIGLIKNEYEGNVKPYLKPNADCLTLARIGMGNINLTLPKQELAQYHSGLGFITASQILEEKLQDVAEVPESSVRIFETYLAQVQLSIKSNNR